MSRYEGYWFTKNGIVFTRVDEEDVERYRIYYDGKVDGDGDVMNFDNDTDHPQGNDEYEEHRYPFAGKANAVTKLGYIDFTDIFMTQCNVKQQEIAKHIWKNSIV